MDNNDKKNTALQQLWSSIVKPVVDLKFFNDAMRTAATLGAVGAIGGYLLDKAPSTLGNYAGGTLLGCSLVLMLFNVLQLFYASLILFNADERKRSRTLKNWLELLAATILSILTYGIFVIIFIATLRAGLHQFLTFGLIKN